VLLSQVYVDKLFATAFDDVTLKAVSWESVISLRGISVIANGHDWVVEPLTQ
jgi:hypothetical protein